MNWDTFWTTFGVFSLIFCAIVVMALISASASWVYDRFGKVYGASTMFFLIALLASLLVGFMK